MKTLFNSAGLLVVMLALLSGCASIDYPRGHPQHIGDDVHSISYTADLRATHFIKKNGRYWVMSEPPPDAAFSYGEQDDIDLSILSFDSSSKDQAGVTEGADDLPLTGRTSYLLLSRELLYRINEMAYNLDLSPEQVQQMYQQALGTIQTVAQSEAANISYQTRMQVTTGSSSQISLKEAASLQEDVGAASGSTTTDTSSDQTSAGSTTDIGSGAATDISSTSVSQ